jgi:hypothetical protein
MNRRTLTATALALAGVASGAAQAQIAVRDAATGQLRAPTAAEAAALAPAASKAAAQAAAAAPTMRVLSNGATSLKLDESHMVYSVARVNAQGVVERECIQGADAATSALQIRQPFAKPIQVSTTTTTARGATYELK